MTAKDVKEIATFSAEMANRVASATAAGAGIGFAVAGPPGAFVGGMIANVVATETFIAEKRAELERGKRS